MLPFFFFLLVLAASSQLISRESIPVVPGPVPPIPPIPPIPSYQIPSYQTPSYQAPGAPAYQAPSYQAPTYQTPTYQPPAYLPAPVPTPRPYTTVAAKAPSGLGVTNEQWGRFITPMMAGQWPMGTKALKVAGYSPVAYKGNLTLRHDALAKFIPKLWSSILALPALKNMIGKTMYGKVVTRSGVIALAYGEGPVHAFNAAMGKTRHTPPANNMFNALNGIF